MSTAENRLFFPPDDELHAFLESENLNDTVTGDDRKDVDVWIDRRLQVLSHIASEIEHNSEVAARRMAMIREAADAQNAVLQRRAAYLESLLEQVALAYNYTKGKTRNLFFGEIGIRSQKEKLVVDEASTVIEWAKATVPEAVRVKEEVDKTTLNGYWQSTGTPIPGCHVEPASEKPFVRVQKETI